MTKRISSKRLKREVEEAEKQRQLDLNRKAPTWYPKILNLVDEKPRTSQEIARDLLGADPVGFHFEWPQVMVALEQLVAEGHVAMVNIGDRLWHVPGFFKERK